MIRIEKINAKNIWDILKLRVSKEQELFVAPNDLSIIEVLSRISCNLLSRGEGIIPEYVV